MDDHLAHVREEGGHWQTHLLDDHLREVSRRASACSAVPGAAEWLRLAGFWHDLGKYRPGFQKYIRLPAGNEAHIEGRVAGRDKSHSGAGALHAIERFGPAGRALAYLIAGHHGGLADWHGNLDERLAAGNPDTRRELDEARAAAPAELLALGADLDLRRVPGGSQDFALWLRMLFSCLVDADFLDTESFMEPSRAEVRGAYPGMATLAARFDAHMAALSASAPDSEVNRLRADVLAQCRSRGRGASGLYSLTVPTGGGKTLSSLAFALAQGKRRIVYAIPYTSIVEQTADVFARIFGAENVVEHHCLVETDESRESARSRLACENWDAPLVVTTNVQLFESLFAAKTSRCRKLHSLCDSVIILDEAQCLPPRFLQPILDVLNLLTRHYGATVVLCTATQPALASKTYFDAARNRRGLDQVVEIVERPGELYRRLKRVDVHLPDWSRRSTWEGIATELAARDCVLAIVNTRGDARKLWRLMPAGTLHLSALMCGAHRSSVIDEIKRRLKDKSDTRPLRVVSTQLVEAGVDLDFPVVFRAFAGLDSIAQAAGRCNREGRLARGETFVFLAPQASPPGLLRQGEDACLAALRGHAGDPLALELFGRYFDHLYYGIDLDERGIVRDLTPDAQLGVQFRSAADKFRLVDDEDMATVFVRYEGYAGIDALLGQLERDGPERWLIRKLQRCAVSLRRKVVERLVAQGDLVEVQPGCFVQRNDLLYDPVLGLLDEEAPLLSPRGLVT